MLISDPGQPEIRATEDVDLICQALTLSDYHRVETALRGRGFVHDTRLDAPVCRWRIDELAVDVMPTLEKILGFSNRWYPLALESAVGTSLPSGRMFRHITAPVFLATKLEAFDGRGKGDFLLSHDLGDLLSVVDGRESLLDECRLVPAGLRAYLAGRLSQLLANAAFVNALPGHLPGDVASQERLPELEGKLRQIARLAPRG